MEHYGKTLRHQQNRKYITYCHVCTVTACFLQSSEDLSLQTQFSSTILLCPRSDTCYYGHKLIVLTYLLTYTSDYGSFDAYFNSQWKVGVWSEREREREREFISQTNGGLPDKAFAHRGWCVVCEVGRTALYLATQKGQTSIVEMLVDKFHANVSSRSNDGSTLMHVAAMCGNAETAMAMLKKGVPINMPNKVRRTCLYLHACILSYATCTIYDTNYSQCDKYPTHSQLKKSRAKPRTDREKETEILLKFGMWSWHIRIIIIIVMNNIIIIIKTHLSRTG